MLYNNIKKTFLITKPTHPMKIEKSCKNYLNCFSIVLHFKEHTKGSIACALLAILSYPTIIIPMGVKITYEIYQRLHLKQNNKANATNDLRISKTVKGHFSQSNEILNQRQEPDSVVRSVASSQKSTDENLY